MRRADRYQSIRWGMPQKGWCQMATGKTRRSEEIPRTAEQNRLYPAVGGEYRDKLSPLRLRDVVIEGLDGSLLIPRLESIDKRFVAGVHVDRPSLMIPVDALEVPPNAGDDRNPDC